MRIVFMGSAPLGCPSLAALLESGDDRVVAVVTQPDRPRGRRLGMAECATKTLARQAGVSAHTPENVNDAASVRAIEDAGPDLVVVVAYGQILKPRLLGIPPAGCVNLHASLLPRYRGAAPIQWALANGETVTGVTTMFMNERLDAGDVILRQEVGIGPEDDSSSLHDRLAGVGAGLLLRTVDLVRRGKAPRLPQDEAAATYAPKLRKEDGRMDWNLPAAGIYHRARGFNPWPGCACRLPGRSGGGTLHVLRVRVEEGAPGAEAAAPGTVVAADGDGPLAAAGDGRLVRLLLVKPANGRAMTGRAYLLGHDLRAGDRLG